MHIIINGEEREVSEDLTVSQLLEEMKTPAIGIAVERNREIVSRSLHPTTVLEEGDVLEIVKMVGGG
ncbi:MAG: sulfur carrier protein ThiS [Proteobacteria bacterium]|nr:sulfur carrier protein ThiS [Pseudomonadota bacterium]